MLHADGTWKGVATHVVATRIRRSLPDYRDRVTGDGPDGCIAGLCRRAEMQVLHDSRLGAHAAGLVGSGRWPSCLVQTPPVDAAMFMEIENTVQCKTINTCNNDPRISSIRRKRFFFNDKPLAT